MAATEAESPIVLVAAVAVVDPDGRVLLAQRPPGKPMAGLLEFPGGKVNAGETPEAALIRELAEELGVEVAVGDRLGDDIALNATTTLRAYRVSLIRGEPRPHDHRALRWVTAAQLHEIDWVPADRGFLAPLNRALGPR